MSRLANLALAMFSLREAQLILNTRISHVRKSKLAVSDCPRSFIEWDGAAAELKALGVKP